MQHVADVGSTTRDHHEIFIMTIYDWFFILRIHCLFQSLVGFQFTLVVLFPEIFFRICFGYFHVPIRLLKISLILCLTLDRKFLHCLILLAIKVTTKMIPVFYSPPPSHLLSRFQ